MVLAARPGYIVCMDDKKGSGIWAALAAPFLAGVLPVPDWGSAGVSSTK